MNRLFGVYGVGGCGRGIMPILREQVDTENDTLVFVDDNPIESVVNCHEVWTLERFTTSPAEQRQICLAIANSQVREMLDQKCRNFELEVMSVRSSTVIEMDDVRIGEGALLSPFVTLTSNIRIGRCFHANLYSYVEHDCRIGDYVTFAPGVQCNGNVHIGDHAYIGAGASLRQGIPGKPLRIGNNAVVGMGAVVTRDVPPGVTVIGNPARPIKRKPEC